MSPAREFDRAEQAELIEPPRNSMGAAGPVTILAISIHTRSREILDRPSALPRAASAAAGSSAWLPAIRAVEGGASAGCAVVLPHHLGRLSDEANPALGEILGAPERIDHLAVEGHGHGVHGEVPATQVLEPVAGVAHGGVPPV